MEKLQYIDNIDSLNIDSINLRDLNMNEGRISTEEAAARLGVKKETIYAYVSRGILSRHKAVDGRASAFDTQEIERLQQKRLGDRPGRLTTPIRSAITEVTDGRVAYRGQSLEEIIDADLGFEAVAALLWEQPERPTSWVPPKATVAAVKRAISDLPPSSNLADRVLLGVVVAGMQDPFRDDVHPSAATASARLVISTVVDALPLVKSAEVSESANIASRLWPRLTTAGQRHAPLLDRALVLLADHGMASSTMAARIAASTRSGPHASIIAGLGALSGPLHGAAGRAVHALLVEAEETTVDEAITSAIRANRTLPGVGHVIHKTRDPRFDLLMDAIMASHLNAKRRETIGLLVERTVEHSTEPPNIDLALGALTYASSMPPEAGDLIFAIARIVGWVAHALEEQTQPPMRFRPVDDYAAAPRPVPFADPFHPDA